MGKTEADFAVWSAGVDPERDPEAFLAEMIDNRKLQQGWSNADLTEVYEEYQKHKDLERLKRDIRAKLEESRAGKIKDGTRTFRYMIGEMKNRHYVFLRKGWKLLAIGKIKGTEYKRLESPLRFPNSIGPVEWYVPKWLENEKGFVGRKGGVVKVGTSKKESLDRARRVIKRLEAGNGGNDPMKKLESWKDLLIQFRQMIFQGPRARERLMNP